ncbi:MAG: hypothetical protein RID42_17250 [Alphaproteobacteria bacterium]|tara:strand:- start:111 stop:596 length:486 start_codon:yes stop_codon:yes gene_type:complete
MDVHMETAHRGQPAGGGVIGNLSVPNLTPETPNFQLLDAALAEIDAARKAARTAGTGKRREHFQLVADDLSNWIADDFLKARRRIPNEPPGRRVPPTTSDLRNMVDAQRRLASARAAAELWDAAVMAALDGGQSNWERMALELRRAESRVAELEREAKPYV